MAKWYEIPAEDRDVEQQRQAQKTYFEAFLKTPNGREVLCDIRRRISARGEDVIKAEESDMAMAQLWLNAFWKDTIELCGVQDMMKVLELLTQVAGRFRPREPEPPRKAEDHSE